MLSKFKFQICFPVGYELALKCSSIGRCIFDQNYVLKHSDLKIEDQSIDDYVTDEL